MNETRFNKTEVIYGKITVISFDLIGNRSQMTHFALQVTILSDLQILSNHDLNVE